MFFNRLAPKSVSATQRAIQPVATSPASLFNSTELTQTQRRLSVLGLAVAAVVPTGWAASVSAAYVSDDGGFVSPVFAAPAAAADAAALAADIAQMSDSDKLKYATEQNARGQYEEAVQTLQAITPTHLTDAEKKTMEEQMASAESASTERKAARAEFEKGQDALNANNLAEARQHFQAALANKFADPATKDKAETQIAAAQGLMTAAGQDVKGQYFTGRAQYRKGDWINARKNLEAARDGGFKPGFLEESPASILAKMDKKEATDRAQLEAAAASPTAPMAARADARAAYKQAREEYRKGDWAAARKDFEIARDNGYKPEFLQEGADKYLARLDARDAADAAQGARATRDAQAKADADMRAEADRANATKTTAVAVAPPVVPDQGTSADTKPPMKEGTAASPASPTPTPDATTPTPAPVTPAQVTPAPVVPTPVTPAPTAPTPDATAPVVTTPTAPAEPELDANAAYKLARQEYANHDWINARKHFEIARDKGYRPELFQDSASKYLARLDAKEAAERAKADADARAATPAPAPVTPAPVTTTDTTTTTTTPPTPVVTAPAVETTTTDPARQALEQTARLEQAARERRQYDAKLKVDQATSALREGRRDAALKLYTDAAELDPTNEAARAGRTQLLSEGGLETPLSTPADTIGSVIRPRRESIQYQFEQAYHAATEAIAKGDFAAARTQIQRARTARDADTHIFTSDELAQFDSRIAEASRRLETVQGETDASTQKAAQDRIAKDEQDRVRREGEEKRHTLASLINTTQQSIRDAKYKEALGTIDQILAIDANNDYARGVRPLVNDKFILTQQRDYRREFDQNMERSLNAAEEKKIPYEDIMRYPPNWPDISEVRDATVRQERAIFSGKTGDDDSQTRAQLDRRLPEINFNGNTFTDVIDFLRDVSGANIDVNWKSLETAGVSKDAPVTTRLRDVKFSTALNAVLDNVGGTVKLGYSIDEGVIHINTQEQLNAKGVPRIYDIRDLIVDVPDFDTPPDLSLQATSTGGSSGSGGGGGGGGSKGGGGGGGGGGGNLFGGGGAAGAGTGEKGQTKAERVDALTKVIMENVAPDSWKDTGGSVGSIKELQGQFIVNQTAENHQRIVTLLDGLRETRAIQVTIETRFLTVSRNYLEDVGLNLDFFFNIKNPNKFSTITATQDSSSTFTLNPTTGVPGGIGSGPNPPQGLNVAGTYLDNFQVNFLLRATQASIHSSLVTAPRITLFNGQRAWVEIATQQAYVSDLTPVVGAGAVSFQPTIDTVTSGVLLDVQATVSADRKYVTLTLRPQLSTLISLVPFAFQQGTSAPAGGGVLGVVSTTSAPTGTIQEPELQITQVKTTVSVPDGGTLLLGGQTLAGETEREAGVPVLSKIPFLKRLFTNRSMAKDENILLILVKPTIIIQKEAEQKQFPLLSSKPAGI